MRATLSKLLVDRCSNDSQSLVLTGDHGYALFDELRNAQAEKFINAGIAEQNMIGVAAGLAKAGFRPIVYGLSAFVPVRVVEQIKIDVAHDEHPVTILGDGAGFVYSHLGTSHQSTEDISCLRAIPQINIFSPCDRHELAAVFKTVDQLRSPAYIRIGKADLGDVHDSPIDDFRAGDLLKIASCDSPEVSIIATGSMVKTATSLSQIISSQVEVWSAPSLKPINRNQLISISSQAKLIITLEEHSVHGGLGSIVSDVISEHQPKKIIKIGVPDQFSKKCGTYDYLLREHGLHLHCLTEKINTLIAEK